MVFLGTTYKNWEDIFEEGKSEARMDLKNRGMRMRDNRREIETED